MHIDNQDRIIGEFIAQFDDDPVVAVKAISAYAHRLRRAESSAPRRVLSDEKVLEVRDLAKSYKVGKQHIEALRGVTLDIHKGEFIAITGASGSGKSTLLQLMGGLDKPTSGTVTALGTNLSKMSDRKLSRFRNQTIGFVFQFFYLQPFLRLAQNLEVAGMPMRTKRSVRRQRIDELAKLVGLADRLRHYPRELSGGQMQRAAIARALLNSPAIILADEPTGNLDSANSRAIIDLFETIRDELGTTVIVVTHDRAIASRADRVIKMQDGVVV